MTARSSPSESALKPLPSRTKFYAHHSQTHTRIVPRRMLDESVEIPAPEEVEVAGPSLRLGECQERFLKHVLRSCFEEVIEKNELPEISFGVVPCIAKLGRWGREMGDLSSSVEGQWI